jgi:hypothetical protein
MLSLSPEERELWIDALGARIRRKVELLVGINTIPEIEPEVEERSSRTCPDSADGHDSPEVFRPPSRSTNLGTEEKH